MACMYQSHAESKLIAYAEAVAVFETIADFAQATATKILAD